jgi:chlorophyllide a reductase subunit Y
MGPAGAGSLTQVINAALSGKARFDDMKAFFEGVGVGHAAGIWQDVPADRPEFRELRRRQLAKAAAKRQVEEIG